LRESTASGNTNFRDIIDVGSAMTSLVTPFRPTSAISVGFLLEQ